MQEHFARSHHFDFRLEMDGVLVSWAVPKGIPQDKAAKRLAVHVEDHPLEYGSFEGEIPAGNYGAGTVTIFDRGHWHPLDRDWKAQFKKGKLKFILEGEQLRGTYLLARMKEEPNWLLRWLSDEVPLDPAQTKPVRERPHFVPPQLARLVPTLPQGPDWRHEIKFDGYRLIAVGSKGRVKLYTRNELDWTERFPMLVARMKNLMHDDFVLDGEAVVFDAKGRSGFGDLQAALRNDDHEAITFVAFDLLHLDGENLRGLPLVARQDRLRGLIGEDDGTLRVSQSWPAADGAELFRQACRNRLEGIISKPAKGRYLEGARKDWVKSKCRARQEFVVCGYTPPGGSRTGFGALVLASYEGKALVPRGKVGTGFSERERERLLALFQPLRRGKALFPFPEKVQWLEPVLVAEIEFAEITRDGSIRQGSYVALREDKSSRDVHIDRIQRTRAGSGKSSIRGIEVTHPDRLVYPQDQITKLEVVGYYERCGELMLPFVANRPLAVLRAPDGITGSTFFQKSFSNHIPPHVDQRKLDDGTTIFQISKVEGILSLAQYGVIEFHPWGAMTSNVERPDLLIWDLDPGEGVLPGELLGAALLLRDYLAERGVTTVVKTSGGKGLHLVARIARRHGWDVMKPFTKAVAEAVAAMNPRKFLTTASKAKRHGRIFIDWLRNGRGSTCVAPWSLRARPGATLSMPVDWSELETVTPDGFSIGMPCRVPDDWTRLEAQTIPASLLRDLGVMK